MYVKEIIRLLVIDHDADHRAILKEMLSRLAKISRIGFRTKIVSSGKRGLQQATEFKPDIILTEIHLPDISGIKIIEQLKANRMLEDTLVLLMTSDSTEETALSGLTSGASDIIFKPVKVIELALKMANLLELRQHRRRIAEMSVKLQEEKNTLTQFFSPDLMDTILKEKSMAETSGISTFATILCVEIRNIETLSTKLNPSHMALLLSDIFNGITSLVYSGYGSFNRFTGDLLIATFGAPIVYANDAYNAYKTAQGIRAFFAEYNRKRFMWLGDEISYGIGIASGPLFAGNIGSDKRLEYTVIGPSVKIAVRLASLSRLTDTDLLIDGETAGILREISVLREFNFSHLKGTMGKIPVFTITDIDDKKAEELYIHTKQVTYDNAAEIGEVEFF